VKVAAAMRQCDRAILSPAGCYERNELGSNSTVWYPSACCAARLQGLLGLSRGLSSGICCVLPLLRICNWYVLHWV
jgi:hypothetical protein